VGISNSKGILSLPVFYRKPGKRHYHPIVFRPPSAISFYATQPGVARQYVPETDNRDKLKGALERFLLKTARLQAQKRAKKETG
jgi:hypothetical protein